MTLLHQYELAIFYLHWQVRNRILASIFAIIQKYSRLFYDRQQNMPYIRRDIEPCIKNDLNKKMVLVSGPRQCGKTTLAKRLLDEAAPEELRAYLNWDSGEDRERILREHFPAG